MADHRTTAEREQAHSDIVDRMAADVFDGLKALQELHGDTDSLYLAAGTIKGAVVYLCNDRQQFERLAEALQHWLGYVEGAKNLRDTPVGGVPS
ncbi:hypothetical protein [Lichenibacterium dinghuense]|uniref:hypothetical protein n=1 Tax=Lichenibacterium dinghuense TaxID=2895977 RepID=UPI001F480284|nr:hypothetical protein [Lichenibacterium sp. 6Y81]